MSMDQLFLLLGPESDQHEDAAYSPVSYDCCQWLRMVLGRLPEGRLRTGLEDLPPLVAPSAFTWLTRALNGLNWLQADNKLDTREAAARQLIESALLRSNELGYDGMRYVCQLATSASVKRLLEARTQLLRENYISLPDDFRSDREFLPNPPPVFLARARK